MKPDTFPRIEQLRAEIAALEPLADKHRDALWQKFRLEWNYNSNHIEGNTLTYGETKLLLLFDQVTGEHTLRELEEMKAHDVAVAKVREWAADAERPIGEHEIRELNALLLVRPFYSDAQTPDGQATRKRIVPGEYKDAPNHVRLPNGELHKYTEPEDVPIAMEQLVTNYRKAAETQHPLIVAARLHYDFVCIHPFGDGNGRTARLLMNYHLLRNGYPPMIIPTEQKKSYLRALQRADARDFAPFVQFLEKQLVRSLELKLRAARGESVEEKNDWEKELELLKKSVQKVNAITIDKSAESVVWVMENSYPVLDTKIRGLANKIDGLYVMRFGYTIYYSSGGHSNSRVTDLEEKLDLREYHDKANRIDRFICRIVLESLSSDKTRLGDSRVDVYLKFRDFKYEVSSNRSGTSKIELLYSEKIPNQWLNNFYNEIGKSVMDEVKSKIS